MTDVEERLRVDLYASADIPVSDRDVEQAWRRVRTRVAEPAARRTRTVALAAAAAAVVAGVAGLAWWQLARGTNDTLPVRPVVTPAQTLVIEYWSHPLWGHAGMVWVYADGRVISEEWQHPYLERRLTPSGLDLLLDRVVQLHGGLTTDESRHPCDNGFNGCQEIASVIQVGGLHYNVSNNNAMADLLFEMDSLFPDGAWRQRTPTPYVPSAYEACYGTGDQLEPGETIEQSSLLDGLPVQVRDLLAAEPTTQGPASPNSAVAIGSEDLLCSRLTPTQASRVAEALDLQLEVNSGDQDSGFETVDGRSAQILVSVILPNGDSGGHGG